MHGEWLLLLERGLPFSCLALVSSLCHSDPLVASSECCVFTIRGGLEEAFLDPAVVVLFLKGKPC